MNIHIDDSAGFCWGVVRTIDIVEKHLDENKGEEIYVLGDIIHNPREIERLEAKGLKTANHDNMKELEGKNAKIFIRAHGEPPSTYKKIQNLNLNLVDATCPLVTALQKRVRKYYDRGYQVIVYGKREHPEIVGIRGVCNDECVVIKSPDDEAVKLIDPEKPAVIFSQTTMNKQTYLNIAETLKDKLSHLIDGGEIEQDFQTKDTICKYVHGRDENLRKFASDNDIILFVAGRNSSNGKSLFNICSSVNDKTFFIEDIKEIDYKWFDGINSLGITGATSTPQWYLKKVKECIEDTISSL